LSHSRSLSRDVKSEARNVELSTFSTSMEVESQIRLGGESGRRPQARTKMGRGFSATPPRVTVVI